MRTVVIPEMSRVKFSKPDCLKKSRLVLGRPATYEVAKIDQV